MTCYITLQSYKVKYNQNIHFLSPERRFFKTKLKKIYFQLKNARGFQTSAAASSDALFVHRDTPEDNPGIKFEFTPENQKVKSEFFIKLIEELFER